MFNAAAVMRRVTGKELSDYDVNINFVGGGNIDGPSAAAPLRRPSFQPLPASPSVRTWPHRGNLHSSQVKPVGGVFEKAYGACQAGMKGIIIPKENSHDIPERHLGLDIHYAADIDDVLKLCWSNRGNHSMEQRVPPQNVEAEQAVLGAMLLSHDAVILAMERLHLTTLSRRAPRHL